MSMPAIDDRYQYGSGRQLKVRTEVNSAPETLDQPMCPAKVDHGEICGA